MGVIICDSGCDLYKDQIKELDVKVINFGYALDGVECKNQLCEADSYDEFYAKIRAGAVATTIQPKRAKIEQTLDSYLLNGEDVLFIHTSKALTTAYNSINKMKDKLSVKYPERKIYVVDSKSLSMGCGVLVYQAAKLLKKGESIENIYTQIEKLKEKIACFVTVKNLDSLKRDAKVSSVINFGGSMLGVRPILKCDSEGKLVKVTTAKGNKALISTLVDYIVTTGDNAGDFPIVIVHSSCEKLASQLKQEIVKVVGEDSNVWIQPMNSATGSHCGADTIILVFRAKYR